MNCQFESIYLSLFVCSSFIISLYIWPTKLHRNDPFRIKIRSLCIFISNFICLIILNFYNKYSLDDLKINLLDFDFYYIGIIKPLAILSIIFFVPIVLFVFELKENQNEIFSDYHVFIRNYIVAPFTEELTYRYIIIKILYPCFNVTTSCFISSFLFAISHCHHYFLDRTNQETTLASTSHQFIFTMLFGLFASSMYFKTNYLITPIILHSVCNFLSVPNFDLIVSKKLLLISTTFFFTIGIYLMIYS